MRVWVNMLEFFGTRSQTPGWRRSAAFDFTSKGILQEACRNTQYWRLKDSDGKPPGEVIHDAKSRGKLVPIRFG